MHILATIARRLLVGMAMLYNAMIAVLALTWAIKPERFWWAALAQVFAPHLFLPLLVLVPLAVFVRSWPLRTAAVMPLLIFLALFGGRLLPRGQRPISTSQLRVVTFNQLYHNKHIDALVAVIRAQQADIVAIQELSEPLAAVLQSELRNEYPFQLLEPSDGSSGLGLISRYPLRQMETYGTKLHWQQAEVQFHETAITVINVHPTVPRLRLRNDPIWRIRWYDTSQRSRQLAELMEAITNTSGPLLVMGDFNTSDQEPFYAKLDARLHDAYRETAWGFGFTFPNNKRFGPVKVPFPLVRIDYIWGGSGIVPVAAYVNCATAGSDHCMVIADLQVQDANSI